jgi:hypothetical protein
MYILKQCWQIKLILWVFLKIALFRYSLHATDFTNFKRSVHFSTCTTITATQMWTHSSPPLLVSACTVTTLREADRR